EVPERLERRGIDHLSRKVLRDKALVPEKDLVLLKVHLVPGDLEGHRSDVRLVLKGVRRYHQVKVAFLSALRLGVEALGPLGANPGVVAGASTEGPGKDRHPVLDRNT